MLTVRTKWLSKLLSERFLRIGREFLWISAGQAAAVLGALVGVRILTELLTPEAYGQLALGMTAATLVNQIALGPLSSSAMRFYTPAREAGALRSFLAAVGRLVGKATLAIALVAMLLGVGLVFMGQSHWLLLCVLAVCFALLSGYNSVLSGIQNAARHRTIVALHQGMQSWGRALSAWVLVVWLGATSASAMLGYVLAMLGVLVSQAVFFRRIAPFGGGPLPFEQAAVHKWQRQVFTYAWPFAAWGVFAWAQLVSDRWALQFFGSTYDVGLYAVLYQIGYYPISLAATLVVQLVAPVLFQRAGDASSTERMARVYNLNWRLTWAALGLTLLAFLTALAIYDFVFRVFVASAYASVAYLLPWMILSGGLFATGQTAALTLLSSLESRMLMWPKVVTAVVGVGLHIAGAAFFGVVGVVAAGLVFAATYLIWILALTVMHRQRLVAQQETG